MKPATQFSLLNKGFCGTLPHLESCLREEIQMRHITLFLMIVASLLWGNVPVLLADPPSAQVALAKPAPAFSLTLFSGETVQLADFRGRVLVLNFWHSG